MLATQTLMNKHEASIRMKSIEGHFNHRFNFLNQ